MDIFVRDIGMHPMVGQIGIFIVGKIEKINHRRAYISSIIKKLKWILHQHNYAGM